MISLCILGVLCVSVVTIRSKTHHRGTENTEVAQSPISALVASGFPQGPAIELNPPHSSSWQQSFPTTERAL
jgi:hypothetical protein